MSMVVNISLRYESVLGFSLAEKIFLVKILALAHPCPDENVLNVEVIKKLFPIKCADFSFLRLECLRLCVKIAPPQKSFLGGDFWSKHFQ